VKAESKHMKILVTGGIGYIGSHTVVELQSAGYDVVVVDNLSNAQLSVRDRVQRISGKPFAFVEADIRDRAAMEAAFAEHKPEAVIHFAGLKAVGESVAEPLRYYDNNVSGSVVLFETMAKFGCKSLVFSSSATVYGDPASVPIREDFPLSATNPYGRSKLMIEEILQDPITWCPTSPRSPMASARNCRSSAAITTRPTAPASAITSTSSTWPSATSRRWTAWPRARASSRTTSVRGVATASWK
jgi:hypothetical protein